MQPCTRVVTVSLSIDGLGYEEKRCFPVATGEDNDIALVTTCCLALRDVEEWLTDVNERCQSKQDPGQQVEQAGSPSRVAPSRNWPGLDQKKHQKAAAAGGGSFLEWLGLGACFSRKEDRLPLVPGHGITTASSEAPRHPHKPSSSSKADDVHPPVSLMSAAMAKHKNHSGAGGLPSSDPFGPPPAARPEALGSHGRAFKPGQGLPPQVASSELLVRRNDSSSRTLPGHPQRPSGDDVARRSSDGIVWGSQGIVSLRLPHPTNMEMQPACQGWTGSMPAPATMNFHGTSSNTEPAVVSSKVAAREPNTRRASTSSMFEAPKVVLSF